MRLSKSIRNYLKCQKENKEEVKERTKEKSEDGRESSNTIRYNKK